MTDADLNELDDLDQRPPSNAGASLDLDFRQRYVTGKVLGPGGMGEVRLGRDEALGREVAMKVVRADGGEPARLLQQRFVREARVQGQLEHPAIVPVYDAGIDPSGNLYFTMKRVRGASLANVIEGLRRGDPDTVARYSLRRLLTLFGSVCMAVHFAHEKGIIHRDLKPANLMLGDFGEVYVLDWGLAKIHGDPPVSHHAPIDLGDERPSFATGAAGTLGYMAPEQLEPPYDVDARADVYALGAILFELLTHERFHARDTRIEIMASTLIIDSKAPSERTPEREIAPELDRLCLEATRRKREERLTSVLAIANAIDAYLDGDRDLELRRQLARDHATRASEALLASEGALTAEASNRALAMREVGAALTLDATHAGARETLLRLITKPPRDVPEEALAEIERNHQSRFRMGARSAALFYFGYLGYLPFLLWMGVRDRTLFAFGWAVVAVCALGTLALIFRPPARADVPLIHLALSTFAVGAVSVIFGPFVLVPMLALGNAVAYMSSVGHGRGLVPLATCLAVVVPQLLRWSGVLPNNYVFADGSWTILPSVFFIDPVATQAFLLVAIVGTLIPACMFVAGLRRAFTNAERRLHLQAWQLRQFVPAAPVMGDASRASRDPLGGP